MPNHKTFKPLYSYMPLIPYIRYIVKPSYKGLGIIHSKPWFVKSFMNEFALNIQGFFEKFRNNI